MQRVRLITNIEITKDKQKVGRLFDSKDPMTLKKKLTNAKTRWLLLLDEIWCDYNSKDHSQWHVRLLSKVWMISRHMNYNVWLIAQEEWMIPIDFRERLCQYHFEVSPFFREWKMLFRVSILKRLRAKKRYFIGHKTFDLISFLNKKELEYKTLTKKFIFDEIVKT